MENETKEIKELYKHISSLIFYNDIREVSINCKIPHSPQVFQGVLGKAFLLLLLLLLINFFNCVIGKL